MSGKHIDTLYVVTGISRLTGEREAISNPAKWPTAWMLCLKWKIKPARKRVYLRLKVEPFTPPVSVNSKPQQLTINFKY